MGSVGQSPSGSEHRQYMTPGAADPVRTLMSSTPVNVSPTDSLRTAATELWSHSVGVVLVGDPVQPVGILSERDVVAALAKGADPDTTTAGQAMTTSVISAHSDDRLFDVALQMLDDAIRHMPVTDEHRGVVGIVSLRDLVRPLVLDALSSPPRR